MTPDLAQINGFFVGLLSDDELAAFNEAVAQGAAIRSYEGVGGFMGMAKVRLISPPTEGDQ